MFGSHQASMQWTHKGTDSWNNLVRHMERHETSPVHADCEYAHMAWISRGRIDDHILFNREEIITQNRYIIHNIIDAIVYLIRGNIAFWEAILMMALHLPLEYLIGQSMDGASNMRGVNKGVQALIFKEAPKAIYVWCHAHRLNLIVIRICGYGNEIKKTMGILDELYNFMNGVKRQGVFTKFQMQKNKNSLKRIKNTTRNWASSFKALQNFLDVYEYIIASLTELSNSDDAITFSISEGLLSRIKRYDFILGLFILRIILKCTHETCIEMQAIGNDLAMMIKLIQHTKNKFQRLRANGDNILTSLHTDVKSFMDKNNVTTDIYNIKSIFKLDQKEFDNYIEQQKEKYKNENFYPVINMIIEQLNERFNYESLNFLNQISIFTPAGLADNENIEISQISEIVFI
ncbi:zinc finger MYM-type protein 1-like [Gordionus sp. m RMFG-2023]|uniref:zinc finger MYM-type protein 1-like n=1 Tax=Gordionus sp. m RMFG-2023 TaxID=3053472 RepID=UPI0031FC338D